MLTVTVLATLVSCRTTRLVDPPSITTAVGTSSRQVEEAILRALPQRGWRLLEQQPGQVVADIRVRGKHYAKVAIDYNASEVTIRYLDSENLKYRENDGRPSIHGNYNDWVENLRLDIERELALQRQGT